MLHDRQALGRENTQSSTVTKGPPKQNTNFTDIIRANFFRDIAMWFDCSKAILRRV